MQHGFVLTWSLTPPSFFHRKPAGGDPKSAEIQRCSQKEIIGQLDLNPVTITLMLHSVSKPLQDRILRGYMQVSLGLTLSPTSHSSINHSPANYFVFRLNYLFTGCNWEA